MSGKRKAKRKRQSKRPKWNLSATGWAGVPNKLWNDGFFRDLVKDCCGSSALLVWLYLWGRTWAGKKTDQKVTADQIVRATGLGIRTVKRVLQRLDKHGYIQRSGGYEGKVSTITMTQTGAKCAPDKDNKLVPNVHRQKAQTGAKSAPDKA